MFVIFVVFVVAAIIVFIKGSDGDKGSSHRGPASGIPAGTCGLGTLSSLLLDILSVRGLGV